MTGDTTKMIPVKKKKVKMNGHMEMQKKQEKQHKKL